VPSWYVVFQGVIGLAQLAIGLAMLAGYRRSGISPAGFELRRPRQPCPPHALAWAALGPRTIGNRGSATDNSGKQMPRSQRCRPIAAGLECA